MFVVFIMLFIVVVTITDVADFVVVLAHFFIIIVAIADFVVVFYHVFFIVVVARDVAVALPREESVFACLCNILSARMFM